MKWWDGTYIREHQVSLPHIYKPSRGNMPLYKSHISHIHSFMQVIAWCWMLLTQHIMFLLFFGPILTTHVLRPAFLKKIKISKSRIFNGDSFKKKISEGWLKTLWSNRRTPGMKTVPWWWLCTKANLYEFWGIFSLNTLGVITAGGSSQPEGK